MAAFGDWHWGQHRTARRVNTRWLQFVYVRVLKWVEKVVAFWCSGDSLAHAAPINSQLVLILLRKRKVCCVGYILKCCTKEARVCVGVGTVQRQLQLV